MDLGLADRVYLVTGGVRGLGRATVDVLVAEGAWVVISGRSAETLAAVASALGDYASYVVADNADPMTPARLLHEARSRWGRIDGALVSVGGPPAGSLAETTDEQWTAAFEAVFLGAVRLVRELSAALDEGGSIALVLSTSAKVPLGEMAVSNGLRPGLAMLTKQLADEIGPRGIRVNGLLPARIATERVAELDARGGDPEAARASAVQSIALRRQGEPSEFGRAAAFLLSPAASFITGAMLPVDGGHLRSL